MDFPHKQGVEGLGSVPGAISCYRRKNRVKELPGIRLASYYTILLPMSQSIRWLFMILQMYFTASWFVISPSGQDVVVVVVVVAVVVVALGVGGWTLQNLSIS